MHYFIIHSGKDYEQVKNLIDEWGTELSRFKCSVLKGTQDDWHDDARAKIRGADKVIYIVGESSGKSENIDWELGVAFEENKEIYVYKLNNDYPLNRILVTPKNKTSMRIGEKTGEFIFSNSRAKVYITDDDEIRKKFREDDAFIASHLDSSLRENLDIAMKQYEIFVETSEELVRRKQNVNSFYITLNSLIVSVILACFTLDGQLNLLGLNISAATVVICLSAVVGAIVCFSWYSVLQSYADLNSSKMAIISYIETQLAYNLYDTEWQLVSNKMGNRKYKSFSKKEMFISKLFFGLYVILFITGILLNIV